MERALAQVVGLQSVLVLQSEAVLEAAWMERSQVAGQEVDHQEAVGLDPEPGRG